MAFRDPFAAYNAKNNVEAHLVRGLLLAAGIEAVVIEDVSQVGVWLGGMVPEIHKPQVWIERADSDRVGPVLADYERRQAERSAAGRAVVVEDDSPIAVECEECGKTAEYPADQRGNVQRCPYCSANVDVGDVAFEGWDEEAGEGEG